MRPQWHLHQTRDSLKTLTTRVLTLHSQQIQNAQKHKQTSCFRLATAHNQDNLSQVTYIYIAIHINKQENNSVNVANFINCKSSPREENSVIIQLKFNVDSIQFNNSVIVANLVSLSGSIQFTFWRLINFIKFIMEVVNLPTIKRDVLDTLSLVSCQQIQTSLHNLKTKQQRESFSVNNDFNFSLSSHKTIDDFRSLEIYRFYANSTVISVVF